MQMKAAKGVSAAVTRDPARPPDVVIIEDDDLIRAFFEEVLRGAGYRCRSFSNGPAALEHLRTADADLVLSDIHMPGMTGFEVLCVARSLGSQVPFVMVSGSYELPLALGAIESGAADYLLKPVTVRDILGIVGRHIRPVKDQTTTLLAQAAAIFDLCNLSEHLARPQLGGLLNALSERRIETLEHSSRVARYSLLVADILGAQSELDLRELELGALLHDIGKVGVPENVIAKTGPLNAEEWRIIKMHPEIGYELLKPINGMRGVADIVLSHHERFVGGGYPLGLSRQEIPLGARIFSVVDTFDAITADRPYRQAQSFSVARGELQRQSGIQFDPLVVEAFLQIQQHELHVAGRTVA
jgi:putative nucleotidyltransferase with HDIG domain